MRPSQAGDTASLHVSPLAVLANTSRKVSAKESLCHRSCEFLAFDIGERTAAVLHPRDDILFASALTRPHACRLARVLTSFVLLT